MTPNENTAPEEVSQPAAESVAAPVAQRIPSMQEIVATISKALSQGKITEGDARAMRQQFGVNQSFFTGKKRDKAKAKHKRQIAAASRRRNRGLGKGEKRVSGTFQ